MAEKIKKISISEFENALEANKENKCVIEWNGIEVTCKKRLSLTEMMSFINGVVESCFFDDGSYHPEIKQFAILSSFVEFYTNIRMPEDIDRRYDLLIRANVKDTLCAKLREEAGAEYFTQYHDILDSIDALLEYRANESINKLVAEIQGITDKYTEIIDSINDIFKDVSPEDIEKLINATVDNQIDEEKLMQAYMNSTKTGEDIGN